MLFCVYCSNVAFTYTQTCNRYPIITTTIAMKNNLLRYLFEWNAFFRNLLNCKRLYENKLIIHSHNTSTRIYTITHSIVARKPIGETGTCPLTLEQFFLLFFLSFFYRQFIVDCILFDLWQLVRLVLFLFMQLIFFLSSLFSLVHTAHTSHAHTQTHSPLPIS